jgi:AcrR family transcriptional regulator
MVMARKTPAKPYHHGDLYETLVKAGTALLIAEGLDHFTLRETARRAGVSHAAPKNHFASVEDLLCEIAARGFEQFVSELEAEADANPSQLPDDRLISMGHAYVRFARSNPQIYHLMFRQSQDFSKTEHLQKASSAAWVQLEDAVKAVIGAGRQDAKARAAHVWALVHGIASLIIDRRLPPVDPEIVIAQSLSSLPMAIRGLGAK